MANVAEDLAEAHKPVSDFLSLSGDHWPITAEAWSKYALTSAQVAKFNEDGYIDAVQILNQAQVDVLRRDMEELMNPDNPKHKLWHEYNQNEAPATSGKVLFHSLGAWRISPAFHDLLFHPAYIVPATQLLGKEQVRLWHDQVFSKPAKVGSVVAWHQDMSYWTRTSPMNHLTVHLTLDDQTLENGALQYVPGSHKWGLKPVTSRHFGDMDSVVSVLDDAQKEQFSHRRPVNLTSGQASFHHALAMHGSYGNASDGPRRATVINVFGDGTVSNTDEPLLEGLPAFRKGEALRGKFFPLLSVREGEPVA